MVDEGLHRDLREIRGMLVDVVKDVASIKEKLNRVDSMEKDIRNLREKSEEEDAAIRQEITNLKLSRLKAAGAMSLASGLGASITKALEYLN